MMADPLHAPLPHLNDKGPEDTAANPNHVDADPVTLRWLIGLRWAVFGLLATTLPVGERLFGFHVRYAIAAPVITLVAAYNAITQMRMRAGAAASARSVAASVALDLLAIGAILAASGGAANPFSAVFVVHVALAASLLPTRTTFALAGFAACLFAALFALPSGTCCPNHPAGEGFSAHLYGMWAAFVMTAALVAYFVSHVRRALDARSAEIERLRQRANEGARFTALGTLAAGTAHELATPLGTIAVLAGELSDEARIGDEARAHAAAITGQVERCRDVIRKMQAGATAARAPTESLDLAAAVEGAVEMWRRANPEAGVRLIKNEGRGASARGGRAALLREDIESAMNALLDNALHATRAAGSDEAIVVAIGGDDDDAEGPIVLVEDSGTGVSPDLAGRIGEPFLTTKAPGEGMGMGLYLVRTWLSQIGGRLSVGARAPKGTRVTLHFAGGSSA